MYFRNVLCTVALATLASAAVAKQIPTPYDDDDDVYKDDVDEVFERDAEAEPARTAAWEEAHGGPAPSYHYGDEEEDAGAWHVARDAEVEPSWQNGQPPAWLASLRAKAHKATNAIKSAVPTATHLTKPHTKQSGGLKKHHGAHNMHSHTKIAHARDDNDEDDCDDYPELSADDVEGIMARDVGDIPDFGEQEVDTSLEGLLQARDVDTSEEEEDLEPPTESEQDLTGYDERFLSRRNADGTDNMADYSPEDLEAFYNSFESPHNDHPHEARDLSADENAEYDEYLASEEHRALTESAGAEEEFDAELYARQEVANDEIPEFDEEDIEGFLQARSTDGSEVPDFGDLEVDTSLEGMHGVPIHARGVDEEDLEDADDVDVGADAAYANEDFVEELVAPVLGARDSPTSATASSRGFFRIPW